MQRAQPFNNLFDGQTWTDLPGKLGESAANRLQKYLVEIPALRARTNEVLVLPRTDAVVAQMLDLIGSARRVDSQLKAWTSTLGESFRYTTVARVSALVEDDDYDNAEMYPGNIDMYFDIWIANIWNNYRTGRMFLNATIILLVRYLAPCVNELERSEVYVNSKNILQQMCDEVCACLPFHMGHATSQTASQQAGTHDSKHQKLPGMGHDGSVKALGGFFLIWPLFVASAVITVQMEQRRWIRGRMFYIASRFGINQAKVLANAINLSPNGNGRPLFHHPRDMVRLNNGSYVSKDLPDWPYATVRAGAGMDWRAQGVALRDKEITEAAERWQQCY